MDKNNQIGKDALTSEKLLVCGETQEKLQELLSENLREAMHSPDSSARGEGETGTGASCELPELIMELADGWSEDPALRQWIEDCEFEILEIPGGLGAIVRLCSHYEQIPQFLQHAKVLSIKDSPDISTSEDSNESQLRFKE